MKKLILLILVTILTCHIVEAQDYSKIEKSLQQKMSASKSNEKIWINIILNKQYDQFEMRSKSDVFQTKEAKRAFVINELKRFSEESQRSVLDLLTFSPEEEIMEVKTLWLANAINCYATPEAIEQISLHPDILLIGYNKVENALFDGEIPSPAKNNNEITYNITQVNADAVWELGYTGEGIIVAVLDTGVNYNHTDLQGNMWEHPDYPYHGYDFINRDNDPMDDHSHGTHCAGTVAGQGASGSQTGIAPNAKIMAIKIMSDEGSGSVSVMCEGIEFAVEHGAHVLSMSFGVLAGGQESDRILFRNALINTLEAGVIASVGAGNEREYLNDELPAPYNVRLPGNCPPPWLHPDQVLQGGLTAVVAVGATDDKDVLAYFSSEGPVTWEHITGFNDYELDPGMGLIRPDVCAPGVSIKSLQYDSNTGYVYMSGTSMATPGVAGVMALMLSKNPNLSPAKISEILEVTAKPLSESKNNMYGSGRVDALAALEIIPIGDISLESYTIDDAQGNNNGKINPGETIDLYINLKNLSAEEISGVTAKISSNSPWISMITDNVNVGTIPAGDIANIEEAFKFIVSQDAPPRKGIYFSLEISDEKNVSTSYFNIIIFDYALVETDIAINDTDGNDNGELDPGESGEMIIYIKNIGNEFAHGITGSLTTPTSSGLLINNPDVQFGDFEHNQVISGSFNVSLSADFNLEDIVVPLILILTDENGRITVLEFEYRHSCTKIPIVTLEVVSERILLVSWENAGSDYRYNVYRNDEILLSNYQFSYVDDDTFDSSIDNCYYVTAICPLGIESPKSNVECYYAPPQGVDALESQINIYPNPTSSILHIEGDKIKTVAIYDLFGKKVEQISVQERKIAINISSYKSNIYILEIITATGEKFHRRFIVAK
ncbi:MAG: S8 family serine peptidase [Bacteroidales bacterium]|jgi:serine protease AprX|nr:S8 family serine peptidase [Bacteroidales bacterium]